MRFDDVLHTFSTFLRRESIRFAVIGGLALQAWGHSRFTRDVDLVTEQGARDSVVAFAESLGFETLHVSVGYSNHLHPERGRIDFMYVDDATGAKLFASTVEKRIIGELSAPVPSPEHLLAMKALAMKNAPERVIIDAPDVQFLLKLPGVDRRSVRDFFERHGLLELLDAIERNL